MKRLAILPGLFTLLIAACNSRQPVDQTGAAQAIENSLVTVIQVKGREPVLHTIQQRMAHYKVPGVSIAVVADGKLSWAKGYGIANAETGMMVDVNTLFQAGSISKPIAALAALKLVEEGKLDLDTDVNNYLTGWKVPENEFTATEKVTLRRLLTHTAGMTVHGFPGYHPTMRFPEIETVLTGRGNTPAIFVDTEPGSAWRYSGGGYTVMEKVVEDVSGMSLDAYLEENILEPLGMTSSTYAQPLPQGLHESASAAYDNEGNLIDGLWHNYPEQAAAGLWTTPSDLAKYCMEVQAIVAGKQDGILSDDMVEEMLTKDKNDWGLGPSLKGSGSSFTFQHGGKNAGFTNNMVAFVNRGDAVIVMTNADNGGRLIGEILNAVSDYYDWDLASRRTVEIVELPADSLATLAGKYKLDQQVPGLGDYVVEVTIAGGRLTVTDPSEEESFALEPIGPMSFIDLEKGDEIIFSSAESGGLSFMWNNRYRFRKAE